MKCNKSFSLSVFFALTLMSCGGGTGTGNPELTEDSSTSGAVAGAAGNALSNSSSSGTLAMLDFGKKETFWAKTRSTLDFLPEALASTSCPLYSSASGAGCVASSHTMWLNYSDCSFSGSAAVWHGTQALTMSAGTASCGTFPNPGANQTLSRQLVAFSGSSTPLAATVNSKYGTVTVIDDASANLKNFNGDTIAPFLNGGYGSQVTFNNAGLRSSIHLSYRMASDLIFDQSINGNLTISDATPALGSQTINGTITVYHNSLQVIGSSKFTDVVHTDGCCVPTSGTIQTTFSQGAVAPTALGSLAVGKTETLTLTGCGTGTLTSYDGTVTNVALTRCY
jgi:hypothetical protein